MSSGIFVELLTLAKKVTVYIENSSNFDTTTKHTIVCPIGKRWFLIGGLSGRDNSSTLDITVQTAGDKNILWLEDSAAGTGQSAWPSMVAATKHAIHSRLIIMDAGEKLNWSWGVAQGASASLSYSYLEVDV